MMLVIEILSCYEANNVYLLLFFYDVSHHFTKSVACEVSAV